MSCTVSEGFNLFKEGFRIPALQERVWTLRPGDLRDQPYSPSCYLTKQPSPEPFIPERVGGERQKETQPQPPNGVRGREE